MKKVLIGSLVALSIIVSGGFVHASTDVGSFKTRLNDGEARTSSIMTKLDSAIAKADARGYDTSSVESLMNDADSSFATFQSSIDTLQASLENVTDASGLTAEIKAERDATKTAFLEWKTDAKAVMTALKALHTGGAAI